VRRESSTVVVLVGEVTDGLLAGLGRAANVSVARATAARVPAGGAPAARVPAGGAPAGGAPAAGTGRPPGQEPAAAPAGWETGALALREASRRQSTYVIVPHDPLADVAAQWRAMWEGLSGPAGFEARAAEVLAAWRDKRFDLPDYYLVVPRAGADGTGADLYLGPLRAARPRRVAVAGAAGDAAASLARVRDALGALQHGRWWPPLDELIEGARRFNAAALAESQPAPA